MAKANKTLANRDTSKINRNGSRWFGNGRLLLRNPFSIVLAVVVAIGFGIAGYTYTHLTHAESYQYGNVPNWNLTGATQWYTINFQQCSSYGYCGGPVYQHRMHIDAIDPLTGNFSAYGCYISCANGTTWYASGQEQGNLFRMHAQYAHANYSFDVYMDGRSFIQNGSLLGFSHASNGLFRLWTSSGSASWYASPNWNINPTNAPSMTTQCTYGCSGNYTFNVYPTAQSGYFSPNGNGYFAGNIYSPSWDNGNVAHGIEGRITGDNVTITVFDPYSNYSAHYTGTISGGYAQGTVLDSTGKTLSFDWYYIPHF